MRPPTKDPDCLSRSVIAGSLLGASLFNITLHLKSLVSRENFVKLLINARRLLIILCKNLAVFRSEKGTAHVLDAYCPHLGANLAIGGQVKGDCLECPFHGWQFRGDDGKCVKVPYIEDKNSRPADIDHVYLHNVVRNSLIMITGSAKHKTLKASDKEIPNIK
ncbi:hypothetical protein CAPTEDRAFT_218200 [Capitella teleta]|uniref:Rieske domain-containing protein n=1 Tax=Capitella teleta TaxID=283909 RepID=R7TA46_CAPTE|nr:hypothetical protein CAPTEDRAFT_218200 [Capitella teleta]|eukprot:ELT88255.1 hypothetical protein CAPTEDRAFT_218200 [Capitella teleta]